MITELLKSLGGFLSRTTLSENIFLGTRGSLINRIAPFVSSEDKQIFVEKFTRVKYAYAVVHWIAKKAAKVPFVLYRTKADGTKEAINVHRLLDLIERPNDYQSRFSFLYQLYGFILTTGSGYIYAPKASTGRFSEMHILPADKVQVVYERRFAGPSGFILMDTGEFLPAEDVIAIFMDDLDFEQTGVGQEGLSPFKPLNIILQKTFDIDKADLAAIQNGGVMGILGFDPGQSGEPLNSEDIAAVERRMKDKAYGSDNKGRFFVSSQKPTWVPIGMSPIDLNLYEANQQVLKDICIVLNVPYAIFDQSDSNKQSGAQQAEIRKQAYTDVILPLVELLTDQFNYKAIQAFGSDLVLDYSTNEIEEMQRDAKQLADTLAVQWWKPVGQKQRESGMEVDPEMENVYLIPSNLVRADDLLSDFQIDLDQPNDTRPS